MTGKLIAAEGKVFFFFLYLDVSVLLFLIKKLTPEAKTQMGKSTRLPRNFMKLSNDLAIISN